jgi:hypothetical protein
MEITFKAKNIEQLTAQYFSLMNPSLQLSPTELKVVIELFLLRQKALGSPEYVIQDWILSSDNRKKIATKLEMTQNNLNVIIHRLKSKTISGHPLLQFKFMPNKLSAPSTLTFNLTIT